MRRPGRRRVAGPSVLRAALVGLLGLVGLGACGSDGEPAGPLVDRIDDAIAAVEAHYGAPQDYFEVSATDAVVSVLVAVEDATRAEQAFWSPDDGLVEPVAVGPMDRPTFRADAIDFRPDRVLDQVRDELPSSEIVDFAVTGGGDGVALYDVRLQSAQGGVLLVLLDRDGRILGAQGE